MIFLERFVKGITDKDCQVGAVQQLLSVDALFNLSWEQLAKKLLKANRQIGPRGIHPTWRVN